VLLQKLQTANADAGERKSTGAPQFGHAARYPRCGDGSVAKALESG